MGQREQQALVKEPLLVRSEMCLELNEISAPDRLAQRHEDGVQRAGFRPLEQLRRGEPPKENVARHKVCEDFGPVGDKMGWGLHVCFLEAERSAQIVLIGKVEASEIVEERDALAGWV